MITELKQIIGVANPLYTVEYEEQHMMNITADEKAKDARFAYIEEFTGGSYITKHFVEKSQIVQIYFCRCSVDKNGNRDMHVGAEAREAIRDIIESEVVIPFMRAYNASGLFEKVTDFKFSVPLPRWDADIICFMLQFICKKNGC